MREVDSADASATRVCSCARAEASAGGGGVGGADLASRDDGWHGPHDGPGNRGVPGGLGGHDGGDDVSGNSPDEPGFRASPA